MKSERLQSSMRRPRSIHPSVVQAGMRYGHLLVLAEAGRTRPFSKRGGHRAYRCWCDCGTMCFATSNELSLGDKVSCGCHKTKLLIEYNHARRTSAEDVIAAIRDYANRHDDFPTLEEWEVGGYRPSKSAIYRCFGSWTAAISAAGFVPRASNGGGTRQSMKNTTPPAGKNRYMVTGGR